MGDDALLTGPHRKGFKAEDVSHDLHVRHFARQLVDSVDLRTVHIFIWIVFEQVTVCLDAEFVAQHLLAVRAYARQEFDVLIENIHCLNQHFSNLEVIGCGNLDVLAVALDKGDLMAVALHNGGIVGETVVVRLSVRSLQQLDVKSLRCLH